jgi:hypothetical protein
METITAEQKCQAILEALTLTEPVTVTLSTGAKHSYRVSMIKGQEREDLMAKLMETLPLIPNTEPYKKFRFLMQLLNVVDMEVELVGDHINLLQVPTFSGAVKDQLVSQVIEVLTLIETVN